jgi:hypothetical protein
MDTCLHDMGKAKAVEKVGAGLSTWPASHVACPADRHMASYTSAKSMEATHGPINTPLPVEIKTHTTFWRFHLQSSHS